jgi:hypothetical protein
MKPWVRLTGLATLLSAVLLVGVLVASRLGTGGSGDPDAHDIPSSTSEQSVAVVKEWIAGGTPVGAVEEMLSDLICSGYYEASGTWDVRCRLPWIPAEGYFFSVVEESSEVTAETEATVTFVRLLRQWGHVPEP